MAIARGLSGYALSLIKNSSGRYVGNTNLAGADPQTQLTQYVKNETGGNPRQNDRVGDINTGIIWTYNGTKWIEGVVDPNAQQIQKNKNDITNLTTRVTKNENDIADLQNDLAQEKVDRQNKDDDLQDQIDALNALAAGVRMVVGTEAEMQAIDKTLLVDGDIINVLADETRDGINAYYKYDANAQTYTFIGSISPYYTKIQIDNKETAIKELIDKKQNKLVAGDGIELTENAVDGTTTIKAKLNGVLSDTPVEDGDKYFSDGGAYKLAPTLNGNKVLENPTFYAPETIGDEGQIITVDANGQLVWADNEAGGGDVKKVTVNNVEQPLDPIDKIVSVDTDDTLVEDARSNLLKVAKANIPITKDEYEALTQAEREDESKVYLITDDVTDTPVTISEIDDTDNTKLAEDFTRSNKYITQEIETPLTMVREWKVGSKIQLNGTVHPFHTEVDLSIYAPTTAGQEGEAVIMGADGIPTWGNASKVTLNGTETKNASFYAPTTAGTAGQMVVMGTNGSPTWENKTTVTLNGTTTKTPSFYAAPTSTASDAGLMLRSRGAGQAPIWTHPRLACLTGDFSSFSISSGSNSYKNLSSGAAYSNFTINGAAIFNPGASLINVPGAYLFIFNGRQTRSNSSGWTTYYYRTAPTDGSTVTIGQIFQSDLSGTRTCISATAIFTISKPCYVSLYVSSTADHSVTVDGYGKYIYLGPIN